MAYQTRLTESADAFHERMFPGMKSPFQRTDPDFIERVDNFAFDEAVAQVDLDDVTRYIGWLSTLIGGQCIDEYRIMLSAALRNGITPVMAKEIVYQTIAYMGIARTFPFLNATNEFLESEGVELPLPAQATTEPTRESRMEAGEQVQVEIFGEGMRDFKSKGDPDYPWINEWLVANCFGDYYTRGGLDLKQRELVTFCCIVAQGGCDAQARAHAVGNVNVGNSKELLVRVVSSNLPFIGYPRTLNALAAIEDATK